MKVILEAAGRAATPAVTQVLNAVHSCASFNIRCARDDEASRVCVNVLRLLHTAGAGRSGLAAKDFVERLSWADDFCVMCADKVYVIVVFPQCIIVTLCTCTC